MGLDRHPHNGKKGCMKDCSDNLEKQCQIQYGQRGALLAIDYVRKSLRSCMHGTPRSAMLHASESRFLQLPLLTTLRQIYIIRTKPGRRRRPFHLDIVCPSAFLRSLARVSSRQIVPVCHDPVTFLEHISASKVSRRHRSFQIADGCGVRQELNREYPQEPTCFQ